jgi:hypothetical protein
MCPYYLDGDLTELESPVGDTRCHRGLSSAVAVATVQFSRAAERALGRPGRREGRPAGTGLSKLNSMRGLKPDEMSRDARGATAARIRGTAVGPARSGRRSSCTVGSRRSDRGDEGHDLPHGAVPHRPP